MNINFNATWLKEKKIVHKDLYKSPFNIRVSFIKNTLLLQGKYILFSNEVQAYTVQECFRAKKHKK